MIAVHHQQVTKCSDKKMEGGNGWRTIDCLRGRLVAERQASKIAEEEAELMAKKVIELEKKLKEETKLRNKAEKRLVFLKKKLESFKMAPILEESNSSENSAFSCGSSYTPNSSVDQKSKTQITNPSKIRKNSVEEEINSYESNQRHESISIDDNSSSQVTSSSSDVKFENLNANASSTSSDQDNYFSLKASMLEMEKGTDNDDGSLVIVEVKIVHKSVCEVLEALKHARENIKTSLERGHMVRVGPINS